MQAIKSGVAFARASRRRSPVATWSNRSSLTISAIHPRPCHGRKSSSATRAMAGEKHLGRSKPGARRRPEVPGRGAEGRHALCRHYQRGEEKRAATCFHGRARAPGSIGDVARQRNAQSADAQQRFRYWYTASRVPASTLFRPSLLSMRMFFCCTPIKPSSWNLEKVRLTVSSFSPR